MFKNCLFVILSINSLIYYQSINAQNNLGLHVEAGKTVLFGADTTGTGARAFWMPSKAAFRAGEAFGSEWDYEKIGIGSFATGRATASGFSSSAMSGATASGSFSTAMSRGTASGTESTALGVGTFANSRNELVIGRYNVTLESANPNIWQEDDYLFVVGRGSSFLNRTNALTLLKNGKMSLGNFYPENAKLLILQNSSPGTNGTVHLSLLEDEQTDWARLRFQNRGIANRHWTIAGRSDAGNSKLNFFFEDGSGNNVVVMDGDNDRVGINRTPTTYTLEVGGNASKSTPGDWESNSDRRIKTDIRDLKEAQSTLMKLRPVSYRYKPSWIKTHPDIQDQVYYHFIAQEYAEVFPEFVRESKEYLRGEDQGILQIDSHPAQMIHLAATQELILENEQIKKENRDLKKRLVDLEITIDFLKSELAKLTQSIT